MLADWPRTTLNSAKHIALVFSDRQERGASFQEIWKSRKGKVQSTRTLRHTDRSV
jgi:hypothetical protein